MTATIEELEPAATPPVRTLTLRPSVREALWGWVFIGPWIVGLLLFTAGPLLATFKFAALAIPLTMIASLGFALLLNHPKLAFKGPLRALVYMPVMIPLVASTLVWLGGGEYPAWTGGLQVTSDRSIWDTAVDDWRARHGYGEEAGG